MANIIKCRGFVLNTIPFKESSLIASVLTNKSGKVKLLAKGIRRPKSKMCGAMEPFSFDEIIFYKREFKDIYTLSDAVVIDSFPEIRGDPFRVSGAMVLCEFYDKTLPMEESNTQVFSEFFRFLSSMRKADSHTVRALVISYLIRAFPYSGVMPHLDDCVQCHGPVGGGNGKIDFSISAGGTVCRKHHDDSVLLLDRQTVEALKSMLQRRHFQLSNSTLAEMEGFVADYIYVHMNNIRLHSLKHFK
ncbi:MAG: DNA repair protein RecO [candidate division WOR-3 bacterium]|nr:MAG: DNA repair protein RecO [candidate division WOR-3 bacterium]